MTLRRFASRIALLALLVPASVSVSAVALAESPSTGTALQASHNDACLTCHGEDAKEARLYVDPAEHAASRHGKLACVSCHLGFNAGVHPEAVTRDWRRQTKLDVCGDCHAQEMFMYEGSFHGALTLADVDDDAPLCADCHEAHNVLSPESPEFRESITRPLHELSRRSRGQLPRQLPRQGVQPGQGGRCRLHRLPRGSPHPAHL